MLRNARRRQSQRRRPRPWSLRRRRRRKGRRAGAACSLGLGSSLPWPWRRVCVSLRGREQRPSTAEGANAGRSAQPPQTVRVALSRSATCRSPSTPSERLRLRDRTIPDRGTLQELGFEEGQKSGKKALVAQIEPYRRAAQAQGQLADSGAARPGAKRLDRYEALKKQDSICSRSRTRKRWSRRTRPQS
jgi:hypothetical protein